MILKLCAIALLVLGEILTMYAEIAAARVVQDNATLASTQIVVPTTLVLIGSVLLLLGYSLGYLAFRDIWVVSAISIASILLLEPGLSYHLFGELPQRGAFIGICCGGIGLLAALFL